MLAFSSFETQNETYFFIRKCFFFAGPSKKLAKNAAAKAALATLCDISYSPMQMKSTEAAPIESNKKQTYELPQTFADSIGK